MQFRNGVFIVTEERHSPLYNMGEELNVDGGVLKLPAAKPTCLTLIKDLVELSSEATAYEHYLLGSKKN